MNTTFTGVAIAGAENTWVAAISSSANGTEIIFQPRALLANQLADLIDELQPLGIAIDGQLSLAYSESNGFRSSDLELRELLPPGCRSWVASSNSLMAVPVRAQLLAEYVAPIVGTVLETHPRATLLLELGLGCLADVQTYKKSPTSVARLSRLWIERFQIQGEVHIPTHDALDALVCATVALAFHSDPSRVRQLSHKAKDRRGRGPFVVLDQSLGGAREF